MATKKAKLPASTTGAKKPTKAKKSTKPEKPPKPRKDYPLFPHDSQQWAKKIKGKTRYFGKWDDPNAAEREWERQKIALLEGREPDDIITGQSVGWLCEQFLDSREQLRQRGEITRRTLNDYHAVAKSICKFFGKGRQLDSLAPQDFQRYRDNLPKHWAPVTTNGHLRQCRTIFKFNNDCGFTDKDLKFAIALKNVSRTIARKHQAEQVQKEFTAEEIHRLLAHATTPMRAFILLGLNAGYGTADIARLKRGDIDYENQWLGVMRGKTGIARGCWLWPETIAALKKAIPKKPRTDNPELAELAFLTKSGRRISEDGGTSHPLTQSFSRLKVRAKIEKHNVGHYALRHTLATNGGDARDQQALDYIIGHHDQSMAATYREGIDPQRVKAVCQHVRKWFLRGKPKKKRANAKSTA